MSIQAVGLFAGYGEQDVLCGVDFVAQPGCVTALLGPNGSGKSTLLGCLSGLIAARKGSVRAAGKNIRELSPKQRAQLISVVPQFADVVFDFSVTEIVEMGLHPWHPVVDIQARVAAAIDTMRLSAVCDRPLTQLSGGEKQRALLARALVQNTQVLLLDEPTAHMDVGYQIAALSLLRSLAQAGKTVVVALHDLNLAAGFADQAALMLNGVIVAQGGVKAILEGPEIERVYGASFSRFHDEKHDRLILAPEFIPKSAKVSKPKRIHLIGGGGSAAALLTELWQLGHDLSLGVAHRGDSDFAAAERLGVRSVSVPAFSIVSDSELATAMDLCGDADVTVYCSPPVGEGNFANLELVKALMQRDKSVVLLEQHSAEWDFTHGRAAALVKEFIGSGVRVADMGQIISDFSEG